MIKIDTNKSVCSINILIILSFLLFRRCVVQSTLGMAPLNLCFYILFYVFLLSLFTCITSALFIYDKSHHCTNLLQDTLSTDPAWPLEILRNTEVNKGRLDNPRRRKKHRGRHAGIRNRLRERAHSPSLPSILLANVQSLENKMDDLRARISFQRDIRDCNILCLTGLLSGNMSEYKAPCYALHRAVRAVKRRYRERIESHFQLNDSRRMWQGLKTICSSGNNSSAEVRADPLLAEELNTFYGHFECNSGGATLPSSASESNIQSSDHVFTLSEDEVRRELRRVNVRKAAGPDGITGRVLRSCADQLAGLFTSIFNESLATSVVPTSFKKSVIIPVPKNSKPSCLNDYRPVALTSTVMKVFQRLLKKHICSSIPATLDPLQFAYRPNRSTDDAISQILHFSLTHIDSKNGKYVRLLFIDYSSAFNTIVPTKLAVKLSDLGLNTSLCDWIQDFLTVRPQVVKVGQFTSNSITLNIGAPQGCVLSPLLYSLYTHDCVSSHSSTSIVKFADDTVVLGLINNDDEAAYLDEVERLTSWCQVNCLSLNVSKTKELIVDFRKRQQRPYTPLMNSGTPVERVSSFKYLGVNISEDLTWTTHIQTQVKKARQRLYHLRQLRKFRVSPAILKTLYSGAIESVLTQCISVWYGNSSNQDCKALQRVVRLAERISGSALPSLKDIYFKRCKSRAAKILKDSTHPGNHLFCLLPSGKRFRSMMAKTERLRWSFFPQAIRLLNTNPVS